MKKNMYFRTVFSRQNRLKNSILDFFLVFASYPRLLLEVFTRKHFGQRYFSFASVVTLCLILVAIPIIQLKMEKLPSPLENMMGQSANPFANLGNPNAAGSQQGGFNSFNLRLPTGPSNEGQPFNFSDSHQQRDKMPKEYKYITWYLFLIAFFVFAYKRNMEVERDATLFDFSHFSLSTGVIQMNLFKPKIANGVNMRRIETFYEPMLFFVPGVILWLLGQPLGWLLVISSICYGLSYAGAYRNGDEFVLDKIDEMIVNRETKSAFVDDLDPTKTSGVRFFARKPTAKDLREKVAASFFDDDDEDVSEAI